MVPKARGGYVKCVKNAVEIWFFGVILRQKENLFVKIAEMSMGMRGGVIRMIKTKKLSKQKLGVYLAGSINGHSIWAKAVNWRLNTAITLETLGYQVFNPLRGRKPEDQNSNDIVERDLQDITKADILLVEMDHKDKAYIGTAMEIRYAWERGKEIVIWGQANKESHWLKYHATAWFDDLDQALDYLRERRAKTSDSYSRRIKTCPERMASSATRIHDGRTRVCRSSGF